MKSGSWFLVILRSFDPVRTFRLEKRLFVLCGLGGLLLFVLLGLGAYQLYHLSQENARMRGETQELRQKVSELRQALSKAAAEDYPPLKIEELQVLWPAKGNGFAVRFWLVQAHSQGAPYSGTLAMVAKNEKLKPPVYRAAPEMALDKGVPRHPEKGKPFEVKGKKFVEALFDKSSGEAFQTLTIFLFSPEGKLILQNSVEIPKP